MTDKRSRARSEPAPVASLVPLLVDETTRVRANAPTRVSRRPARPDEQQAFQAFGFDSGVFEAASAGASSSATKVERAPATIDVGDMPTLVVPPPVSMSSGARRRPHEIAEDVASDFGVSPFDDVETQADAHAFGADSLFDVAPPSPPPSMADVWRDADSRAPFMTLPPTSVPVDSVDVIEAVPVAISAKHGDIDVDVAPLDIVARPRPARRWSAALLVALTLVCALFVDDASLSRTASFGESAIGAAVHTAMNDVVPQLRELEGRARWVAARSR